MASPQKENGHLRIANELVEILAQIPLTGSEWQMIWAVWRKTWCWHKKEDWIALSQLEKATGMSRVMVCRVKKKLVYKCILVQSKKGLSFNKNYDDWVVSKSTLVYKRCLPSVQTVLAASVQTYTHNNNYTKETIQKDIPKNLKAIKKMRETLKGKLSLKRV